MSDRISVYWGDSRVVLADLPDASVDAVVSDPPYALVSIVRRFGGENAAPAAGDVYRRASAGFMGKTWDTGETAFDPAFWAEVLRVAKPGAHMVLSAGTRSYHRLACAVEDAGWEIRDMLAWLYGSGFPKSHDMAKAIDREQGLCGLTLEDGTYLPASEEAQAWLGWGTSVKPGFEPICFARKPIIGTIAANLRAWGVGALNIDACRVAAEGCDLADGRWPANVAHDGSAEVVAAFPQASGQLADVSHTAPSAKTSRVFGKMRRVGEASAHSRYAGKGSTDFAALRGARRADAGSAARFFYSAKADAADRAGSAHPTVKPVDMVAWMARLVTPPDGLVLDPFAGSGTTGAACVREGFRAILIERERQYVDDINRRFAGWVAHD